MNEHNKRLKSALSEVFKKNSVDIDGVKIPLLGKQTKQIIVECNDGSVSDVKTDFRTG